MRDRNALVTRDVTGESQHPVPTRPYPTRPALYIERGETSHHGVAYVTRVSAAPAPVEPRDDMMTGLAVIEGIDLDAEVPCAHSQHDVGGMWGHADEPAAYIVRNGCPCGRGATYPLCRSGWVLVLQTPESHCPVCDTTGPSDVLRIVEVLR